MESARQSTWNHFEKTKGDLVDKLIKVDSSVTEKSNEALRISKSVDVKIQEKLSEKNFREFEKEIRQLINDLGLRFKEASKKYDPLFLIKEETKTLTKQTISMEEKIKMLNKDLSDILVQKINPLDKLLKEIRDKFKQKELDEQMKDSKRKEIEKLEEIKKKEEESQRLERERRDKEELERKLKEELERARQENLEREKLEKEQRDKEQEEKALREPTQIFQGGAGMSEADMMRINELNEMVSAIREEMVAFGTQMNQIGQDLSGKVGLGAFSNEIKKKLDKDELGMLMEKFGGAGGDDERTKRVQHEVNELSKKLTNMAENVEKKMTKLRKELDTTHLQKMISSKADASDVKKEMGSIDDKVGGVNGLCSSLKKDLDSMTKDFKKVSHMVQSMINENGTLAQTAKASLCLSCGRGEINLSQQSQMIRGSDGRYYHADIRPNKSTNVELGADVFNRQHMVRDHDERLHERLENPVIHSSIKNLSSTHFPEIHSQTQYGSTGGGWRVQNSTKPRGKSHLEEKA